MIDLSEVASLPSPSIDAISPKALLGLGGKAKEFGSHAHINAVVMFPLD